MGKKCKFEEYLYTGICCYITEFVFVFSPTVCLASKSELVYFTSRNFKNTLHWIPAEPAVPGENITYKYSVEYKM